MQVLCVCVALPQAALVWPSREPGDLFRFATELEVAHIFPYILAAFSPVSYVAPS